MEPSLTPKSNRERSVRGVVKGMMKASTVHMLCFALIYTPTIQAQELMQALGGAFNIIKGGMNQAMQQQQAAIAQAQMQAQMNSLQPQMMPSKYHPQCAVSQAVTDFPVGACTSPLTTEQDLAEASAYRQLAVSYDSFFQNLLAESQNGPQPVGVQCIQEANKRADGQIQDRIIALQALINQVKMESQAFEQNQQKIKEEMDKNRDILYGNKTNNAETANTNFLTEFSPSCQTFYKQTGQPTIKGKGFAGLRDDSEQMKNQAGTFFNNQTSYVNDINNQLKSIRNGIKKDGLSADMNASITNLMGVNGRTFAFGSAEAIIQSKVAIFKKDFEIIQRDLGAVGFNVTADDLNGDFNERMSRFAKGAGDFFRKEAIAKCVNGSGDTGIGLDTNQILNGLRHRTASGSATTLSSYKTALTNILTSDAFIDDKMAAIQRLDQRYGVGEVYVQVKGADARSRSVTPYGLYKQQIDICKARIEQDDTFSTTAGLRDKGGSAAERIQDAERALKKAINLEKNFSQELTTSIYNRVVNCEGIQKSEEKCMPGQGGKLKALDTSDGNFCISQASTCANQARACYIETDTLVKKKQQAMSTMASEYNARVSGLIAKQQFFLKQVVGEVIKGAELISQFIPGTKYAFPADLFVKMPQEKMDNGYGVAIAGDINNIDNLTKDLPKKLGDLKKLLEGQQVLVAKELGDYLNKQKAGMTKDKDKWKKLESTCIAAIEGYNTAVAQQNQAQGEAFGESNSFCQKFNALAQNPAAGCGQAESLFEDSMNVTAGLANPGAVRASALEFQNFCNQTQNESERGGSDRNRSERDFSLLAAECEAERSSEGVITYLRSEIESAIPSSFTSEQRTAITSYIEGNDGRDIASVSSELRRSSFFRTYVRPFDTIRSRASSPSAPTAVDGLELGPVTEAINAIPSSGPNFCEVYAANRNVKAYESCDGEGTSDRDECFREKVADTPSSSSPPLVAAAELVAANFDSATSSQSQRIGERMNATPCMAQQGANGANGFNLSGFDQSILGAGGLDVLNGLGL
jgi:hypothetical protein